MKPELKNAYRYWRNNERRNAESALAFARADIAANHTRYPRTMSRGPALGAAMDNGAQWGNPDAIGLRFVGWQDEILRRDGYGRGTHTGWYTRHDEYDEVLRGCVYQLPARDGCARYVPAYREGIESKRNGWEDTSGEHMAALDFSNVITAPRDDTDRYNTTGPSAREACRAADSLAENAAEKSREYDEAWHAGSQYADLRAELKETRKECRALVRELKAARSHTPAICRALRSSVREMRRDMRDAFEKAEALKDKVWREYHAAFNDGAGSIVFRA